MRRAVLLAIAGLLTGLLSTAAPAAYADSNPVTPGTFTGYGFDQCLAPTQKSMNAWLRSSPFLAVGIYISGDSRACRSQPNLTTDWIATQLSKGWRLLPITLGPQASCNPRFPRYRDDEVINPRPGASGTYKKARAQARAEADTAVAAATALGITKGSTLWYDLEGFDLTNRRCRESSLAFLSAWTTRLHAHDWASGVYSSAGSGIKMLDDARVKRPDEVDLPDYVWIARWSGVPGEINDADHTYIRDDGWMPAARVHQYQGGHNETWGGVTINIDRDYLVLDDGHRDPPVVHCGGVVVDAPSYPAIAPGTTERTLVKALKCLLTEQGAFTGRLSGTYGAKLLAATQAWQTAHGFEAGDSWLRRDWMTLLAIGDGRPVLKLGSTGEPVRWLQRALNAASAKSQLSISGTFGEATDHALRRYQRHQDQLDNGIVIGKTWHALRHGLR